MDHEGKSGEGRDPAAGCAAPVQTQDDVALWRAAFAANVKEARVRLRLSQTELARRAGVTPATLSDLERAETSPSFALMVRLAGAIGVSLPALLRAPTSARAQHAPQVAPLGS